MATATIDFLDSSKLCNVFGAPSEGKMADTFLCALEWSDGTKTKAYAKCFSNARSRGLVNEITGFLLAKSAHIPVPARAGLLEIPAAAFPGVDPINFYKYAFVISEAVGETLVSSYLIGDLRKHASLVDLVRNWTKLPEALAFDDWVANVDRNQGNILIRGPDDVILIDHSNLPFALNWKAAMLDPSEASLNTLALIVHGSATPTPSSVVLAMQNAAKDHISAYNSVSTELRYWWDQLLNNDKISRDALETFIEKRALNGNSRVVSQRGAKVA